ncbi:SprT family protein [Periweissella ghanensis]|nr:SprT family protein [Periweissella ghanensis]MCM0601869.1 SprT family protein [Periweissella ghanensis]
MTDAQLQSLVERISMTVFGQPFLHHATFNARLRTTGGRYRLQDHNIDINPKMLTEHDMATLVGVIKHELVHYHLHLSGQPYQHVSSEFKQLLKQVDGLRFAPRNEAAVKTRKYHYVCQKCAMDYYRQRQIDLNKYVCGRCQGKLQLNVN